MSRSISIVTLVSVLAAPIIARGGDWPMWRYDACRSAVCDERLPDQLHLQWVRRLPPQNTAWKDESSMMFDRSYLPIVSGKLLIVGSTTRDCLTAYDVDTGAERWRFYCGGPVRVAPAAYRDRIYVASDDGYLRCIAARDGRLQWKFRGGPSERRLIGNERLISSWPARGGPVVSGSAVYFAVGVWPFMGTFVYALDAESGRLLWHNDSTSFTFRRLPHYGSVAFSGLSPQGHLAIAGDRLIVPGSRGAPALFDCRTGEFLGYAQGQGPVVVVEGSLGFAGGQIFDVTTGNSVRLDGTGRISQAVLADDTWYTSSAILDPTTIRAKRSSVDVPRGNPGMKMDVLTGSVRRQGSLRASPWLRADSRLVVSNRDRLQVLDTSRRAESPTVIWEKEIGDSPSDVLAADSKLFAVTLDGSLYCFGGKEGEPVVHERPQPGSPDVNETWDRLARDILDSTGASEGYCLVLGLKDGGLVEALLRQSELSVIAVDHSAAKIDSLRGSLDSWGLYGRCAAAINADPASLDLAPYLASLIVSEEPSALKLEQDISRAAQLTWPLRPYGGAACLQISAQRQEQLRRWIADADLAGFQIERTGDLALLTREGPLPGSAPWQGQNADAGNTRCSGDQLVLAPLGVLWFGNALSNSLILPRHGEGPVEQVAGGRMFIEGPDSLSATDVYTGRLLWTRDFPGLGQYYVQTKHQRGAHVLGSNFFAVSDTVYVAHGKTCHALDPATGRTRKELKLPGGSEWMFLLVYDDLLIAGSDPQVGGTPRHDRVLYNTPASSKGLVVMDRRSGQVLWTRKAQRIFGHYAVCAGSGRIFCIDRTSPETMEILTRRGQKASGTGRIYALHARSGEVQWQSEKGVGIQVTYSEEHDVLLSGAALRGADGQLLWNNPTRASEDGQWERDLLWSGKWGLMLRGSTIFPQGNRAFDLLTGQQKMIVDPQGNSVEWTYPRSHGCGPKAASQHMLTFRSACAGFVDLRNDSGTGNLGGFRSSCTSNLIVADGVLNAPDYTRTCSCSYQNRSSLGLVHMPEVEYWTYGAHHTPGRVGYNLGAPGDRRAADSTLWRAVPNRPDQMARDKTLWWGNPAAVNQNYAPKSMVELAPKQPRQFYLHASRIKGEGQWKWIGGSGVVGLQTATVPLCGIDTTKKMAVRLCFAEPENDRAGMRVFDVALDGKEILRELDVFKEACDRHKAIVREFVDVDYSGRKAGELPALQLTFRARHGEPLICGIEVANSEKN